MEIAYGDGFTQLMDIENAHKEFNLRLREFAEADDMNFAHDFCGIQQHIDRRTGKMGDCFLPRFAGNE